MSTNINNQRDFFKNVNLDDNGNLGVVLSGGTAEKYVQLEIGSWDMNNPANGTIFISHGLSATEWKTVRQVEAEVIDDGENAITNLNNSGMINGTNSATIILVRIPNGNFQNVNYDDATMNRGWVTFWYTPD